MLEFIGLVLAFIDFAGWASKLEAWLGVLNKGLSRFMLFFTPGDVNDPDQLRGFEKRTDEIITFVVVTVIVVIALAFLYYVHTSLPHPPYPTTFGGVVLLIVGFILGFIFACLLAAFFLFLAFNTLIWLIIAPLTLVLHLMSIPRRGIVATLGLLLAAVGFVERFF